MDPLKPPNHPDNLRNMEQLGFKFDKPHKPESFRILKLFANNLRFSASRGLAILGGTGILWYLFYESFENRIKSKSVAFSGSRVSLKKAVMEDHEKQQLKLKSIDEMIKAGEMKASEKFENIRHPRPGEPTNSKEEYLAYLAELEKQKAAKTAGN